MRSDDYFELRSLARHDANVRRGAKARHASECEGKTRFGGYAAANRAIRPTTEGRVVPFRCRQCNGWHLGRSAVRDRRVAKEFA